MFEPRHRIAFALLAIAGLSLPSGACTSTDTTMVGVDAGPNEGSQQSPDASGEAVCYAKSCPRGYGDCPGSKYPCGTDLSNDPENCGSCGNACPNDPFYEQINVRWVCSRGQCERRPTNSTWTDCDKLPENGYETNVSCNPHHCGVCGNECAPDQPCVNGICGCKPGFVNCGSTECGWTAGANCKNLLTDTYNCGACGKQCVPPAGEPDPVYPEGWACDNGKDTCALACYLPYAHCTNNPEDRCETNTYTDPKNCGGCGIECQPGQTCSGGKCRCPPGSTMCAGKCVVLDADPRNCGACYNFCPGPLEGGHGFPTCTAGKCGFECAPQYGDCNGLLNDGCETYLRFDPKHCGGCNIQCEPGTPCIEGSCATVPCTGEPVR